MKKRIIIGVLLVLALFLVSGCSVSDYLTGNDVAEVEEVEIVADDMDESSEIDAILKELEEETDSSDEIEELKDEVVELDMTEEDAEEETTSEKDEKDMVIIKVKEGEKVKLKPVAEDPDKDKISYTFTKPVNADGEWQTGYGDAGDYTVTVTASDGKLKTTRKVKIQVSRVNVAPIIKDIKDITANEGDTVTLSPKVSDPNGDKVTVTISDPVGDDGVWKIPYQKAGDYRVTITATDGEKTTKESFVLKVNKKNVPPVIENVEDLSVKEGDTVRIKPEVSDVNGDKVTVTISDPVGNDGLWETDFTDNGEYEIVVKAADSQSVTTKTITLKVEDVNKPPVIVDIKQG